MDSFLEVNSVTKIFNKDTPLEIVTLKDICLDIKKGEFVVLSGPSGSGKTTLLNLIGALDSITEGSITIDGLDITNLSEDRLCSERRDNIGFIFQAYNLIEIFNAYENIEYIMKLQGVSESRCKKRVLEVAEKLGIEEYLYKLPSKLSGGQQQRVAVARAVASKPKLILADEPTANLDSKSANDLINMMQKLNEEENITIIFSSHDPMVINKAKRLIVLKDGEILKNEMLS
jgi:putative ABC transport system ATP-binding protein